MTNSNVLSRNNPPIDAEFTHVPERDGTSSDPADYGIDMGMSDVDAANSIPEHLLAKMAEKENLPDPDIMARMKRDLERLGNRITNTGIAAIHPKGASAFTMPDGSIRKSMQAVIVGWTNANMFYTVAWSPNKVSPPACYAVGQIDAELKPRANSPQKQHDECASCPKNQYKSASNGKGKACRNSRNIVIMLKEDGVLLPDMYSLSVPPTSLKAFDKYVTFIANRYGCMPLAVVTTIGLEPDTTWPVFTFNLNSALPAADVNHIYRNVMTAENYLEKDIDFAVFERT